MDLQRLRPVIRQQAGLVGYRQLMSVGIARHRLRTLERQGVLSRYLQGVYLVVEWAPEGLDAQRSRAAWSALLSSAPHGISSGACALHLHGVQGLPQVLTPEVAVHVRHRSTGVNGVRMRQYRREFECRTSGPWQIAAPIPALVQALPDLGFVRGVCVLDSALNRRVISGDDLAEVRRRLHGRRGTVKLARCWGLIDGGAGSPIETRVRLECVAARLAPTELQVKLTDANGRIFARGDLGWLRRDGTWVLVEVDGKDVHSTPQAVFRDRSRQNQIMLDSRHTMLRFTAGDLGRNRIADQVRRALQM